MKRDRQRLRDILDAIERIQRYAERGQEEFLHDELLQTWVVYHLQIIGEASAKLSPSLRDRHAEVPWRQIVAMRNILVHDYLRVDADEVWQAVVRDLPSLEEQIQAILSDPDV